MATLLETINTQDPGFLKEYEGKLINAPEGTYQVKDGNVSLLYTKEQMDKGFFPGWNASENELNQWRQISQQLNQAYGFDPTSGLESTSLRNTGSGMMADAFRYYNPTQQAEAKVATQNFGMGTEPAFRPRAEGETMEQYLQAKKAAGFNVDLGAPNLTPTQAQQEANWAANQEATFNIAGMKTTSNMPVYQVPFKEGLSDAQKTSIENLVNSGRALNEIDAKNYAYAIGDANWQQYIGKSGMQLMINTNAGGTVVEPGTPTPPIAPTEASNSLALSGASAEKFNSLSPQQQQGIMDLAKKPVSNWTQTDINNWNYATNNAPLPKDATLISPSGEKKVVVVGSPEANNLLNAGWGLHRDTTGGGITPGGLSSADKVPVGGGATGTGSEADIAAAGAGATADQAFKDLQDLYGGKEQSKYDEMISNLLTDFQKTSAENTGRGAAQTAEELAKGVPGLNTKLADKNAELQAKLAEVKTLDAAYQRDKGIVEEKVISMGRMAGQLDKEYKKYLLEKNLLVSEASSLQADVLGLQGKLEAAQKAADRAVDLKYLDITQKLESQLSQLQVIMPFLEREDAQYAKAVDAYLTQQRDNINYQRDFAKMEFAEKLGLISKYGVGSTSDSMESLLAKVRGTGQYQEENRIKSSSGSTSEEGNYFTKPEADGTIGYYWQPKGGAAQKITEEQYMARSGKEEGLTTDEKEFQSQLNKFKNDIAVDPGSYNDRAEAFKRRWELTDAEMEAVIPNPKKTSTGSSGGMMGALGSFWNWAKGEVKSAWEGQ